jgi:hypothetical protein
VFVCWDKTIAISLFKSLWCSVGHFVEPTFSHTSGMKQESYEVR